MNEKNQVSIVNKDGKELVTAKIHQISPLFKTMEQTGIDVIDAMGDRVFSLDRRYQDRFYWIDAKVEIP